MSLQSKQTSRMPTSEKQTDLLSQILQLRTVVGFLGSKKQFGWWDCLFLDETGLQFLATTFPRSAKTAALNATVETAERVHDRALGRIGCFHLFRLPVCLEDQIQSLQEEIIAPLDKVSALEALGKLAGASIQAPEGPVQVGVEKRILTETSIAEMAAHYQSAFGQGIQCFPYFSADRP